MENSICNRIICIFVKAKSLFAKEILPDSHQNNGSGPPLKMKLNASAGGLYAMPRDTRDIGCETLREVGAATSDKEKTERAGLCA